MSESEISVAVSVAVDRAFTYRVPQGVAVPGPGSRVLVPFGGRALVGVVRPQSHAPAPDPSLKLKAMYGALDIKRPSLPSDVVELCEWMSQYYLAPLGEVYRLALPGLLGSAESLHVALTETGASALDYAEAPLLGGHHEPLDKLERRLCAHLREASSKGIAVTKLPRLKPKIVGVLEIMGALEERGLCRTWWRDDELTARTETHLRRTDYLRGGAEDEPALQKLVGRSKQRRAVLDELENPGPGDGWLAIGELRARFPRVRVLIAGLLESRLIASEERTRRVDPFDSGTPASVQPQAPTEDQAAALAALRASFDAGGYASTLLHGITGSGKTEVYLQFIAHVRAVGQGAIVLVPEIALTPQLSDRFRARFGDEVTVLHSGLTPRQRLDAWQHIRDGETPIVIGARSAVFAPMAKLGVIVVDEEHDGSFKQEDGVRYNARDVALVRARALGASVVLGSATPSLETYELARSGRHAYLRLRTRPTPRPLPKVEVVALSVHRPDPESLLTSVLKAAVRSAVDAGEQAIIFLNRRGFTTTLICELCGSLQQCPDCSAPSMTYHLSRNRLMCHLCGYLEATPDRCRSCGSNELTHGGVGTERVEVALARSLEGVRVARLDRDATRGRALLETLASFRRREADVLVGTQMLSKGHDFPGVTLVGILQGDHGLALPDLRAAERTFQLLTQVAGRAGRGERPGRVIIQAYAINAASVRFAAKHDFEGFAAEELEQRAQLGNPPSGFLALVRVSGAEQARVKARAEQLAAFLQLGIERLTRGPSRPSSDEDGAPLAQLLGPTPSPIVKINRRFRWQLLLRARTRPPLRWLLDHLRTHLGLMDSGDRQTLAIVDVDPMSLL